MAVWLAHRAPQVHRHGGRRAQAYGALDPHLRHHVLLAGLSFCIPRLPLLLRRDPAGQPIIHYARPSPAAIDHWLSIHGYAPALLEYKLQTAADAPTIRTEFIEIPDPNAGPYGAKGLAEAPNVPTAAAIANGVAKLVGTPVRQLPMTAERVWMTSEGMSS